MATSFDKNDKSSRRAAVDDIRRQQSRAERRKAITIVGVCALLALLIIGAAAYKPIKDWWDLRKFDDTPLAQIGAAASVCQKVTTKPGDGAQQHVPEGTPIEYPDAPPAFGQHYFTPDGMERKLYTTDRPELGTLVHNLEHGYTILWYDETIADDSEQMDLLRAVAKKLAGTDNMRLKFKAVPWTKDDGKAFPDDQHIAFTHWSVGGAGNTPTADNQIGVWQYCSEVSGAALDTFMSDYPYLDSPEPAAG